MSKKVFGYARVSSREQNADRQIKALLDFGVSEDNIFVDKKSGKDTDREKYLALRNAVLREGDTLVVKELDRLSRNKSDIKKELEYFKENNIRVKILDIPTTLADFPDEQKWVIEMINNILIEVLGSIAEAERLKIHQRQREGIDAAQQRGIKFGRPNAVMPDKWQDTIKRVKAGDIKAVDAMRELKIKKSSYYHLLRLFPVE